MKIHWWPVAALALLSACSSVPLEEPIPGRESGSAVSVEQPLTVPPLSALPETPARPLQGRYTAVSWDSVPGWVNDDLTHVWKGLLNDCRGLMRPVSGSLAMPARAAPRAW
ncbi:MAG: hypothetical protein WBA82_04900, partial [Castellaniella sp.]